MSDFDWLLRRCPNLAFAISWRVRQEQLFSDPATRALDVDLLNRWLRCFLSLPDCVAAAGEREVLHREELAVNSAALGKVDDEAVPPPLCRAAH